MGFTERLNGLELKSHLPITATSKSYEEYEFREGDVVYCDPPYQGTTAADYYTEEFDHDKFWEWIRTQKQRNAAGGKSGTKGNEATEHLYIHRKYFENNFIIANK